MGRMFDYRQCEFSFFVCELCEFVRLSADLRLGVTAQSEGYRRGPLGMGLLMCGRVA